MKMFPVVLIHSGSNNRTFNKKEEIRPLCRSARKYYSRPIGWKALQYFLYMNWINNRYPGRWIDQRGATEGAQHLPNLTPFCVAL